MSKLSPFISLIALMAIISTANAREYGRGENFSEPSVGCRTSAGGWILALKRSIYSVGEYDFRYGQDFSWDYSDITLAPAGTGEARIDVSNAGRTDCKITVHAPGGHGDVTIQFSGGPATGTVSAVGSLIMANNLRCEVDEETWRNTCNPIIPLNDPIPNIGR
jgi:hypothetical protein